MCVVPVKVKHKGSNPVYSIFAMLDNSSQGKFVKTSLMKTLRIKGQTTSIIVKILLGEERHSTFALEGLKVCSKFDSTQEWIDLPKSSTKENLPVDSIVVVTAQKIGRWEYLLCMVDEVIQHAKNGNEELLININCKRALEPIKLIPSRNDRPYATAGTIACNSDSEGRVSCSKTVMWETGSDKIGSHYFAAQNKEISNNDTLAIFKRMYEQTFIQPKFIFTSVIWETLGDILHDDQTFLRPTDQKTIQANNHYQVPLPLKSTDVTYLNNKSATKRLF